MALFVALLLCTGKQCQPLTVAGLQNYSDMFTHLLRNRIIFIGSRITDEVTCTAHTLKRACHVFAHHLVMLQTATQIVASMLALEAMGESEDIQLYINSQGLHILFVLVLLLL